MSNKLRLPTAGKTGITMQVSGTHVDLYLFGVIGDWWDGNTANDVLHQLRSQPNVETITVKLSTIGGYFEDGLPIYNLLKQHPATVTTEVIGCALSMGSVIMLAGSKIRIAQNALVMIHNAQGVAWGSPPEMRKAADILAKHEQAIIPRYMERMGKTEAEIQALLDAETWFTADEALAAGLVDEIIDPVDLSAIDKKQPENAWQFAAKNFKHPPEAFVERVENAATRNRPWVERILNRVVGNPPSTLSPPDQEVDMDTDEIAAKVAAKLADNANNGMIAAKDTEISALKADVQKWAEKYAALEAQAAADKAALAEKEAFIAEQMKGVPVYGVFQPPVAAPAGSMKYDY